MKKTKRQVFTESLSFVPVAINYALPDNLQEQLAKEYDEGIPDGLPTLNTSAGNYLKDCKERHETLLEALNDGVPIDELDTEYPSVLGRWFNKHEIEPFAKAWVLGYWIDKDTKKTIKS